MKKETYVFNVIFKNESHIQGYIIANSLEDAYKLVEKIPFEVILEQTDYKDNSFLNEQIIDNELVMKKEINLFNEYGSLSIYLVFEQKKFPFILEVYRQYLIDNPIEDSREYPIDYLFNKLTKMINNDTKEIIMLELKNLFHYENMQSLLIKVFYI